MTILVEQNKGLVRKVSFNYTFNGRFEMDDLIQEAYIGFLKAVEKYDFNLENRASFSTYSIYWINAALNKYTKRNKHDTVSLETPTAGEDEDITLLDSIPDSNPGPEEFEEEKDYKRYLRCSVSTAMDKTLTLREREVIKMHYGFYGSCVSLEKIGDMLNCTKENVRQQENRSLRKLRYCSIIILLRQEMYIDSYMKNTSMRHYNTELAAINDLNSWEKLKKNTGCPCIGNEHFFKWYKVLYKNWEAASKELDRISKEDYLFPGRFMPNSRLHYTQTIERQAELQKQIKEIGHTIEAVKYFAGQLIYKDYDSWSIFMNLFKGDSSNDIFLRRSLGQVEYITHLNHGIDFVREGLQANNIQYDF